MADRAKKTTWKDIELFLMEWRAELRCQIEENQQRRDESMQRNVDQRVETRNLASQSHSDVKSNLEDFRSLTLADLGVSPSTGSKSIHLGSNLGGKSDNVVPLTQEANERCSSGADATEESRCASYSSENPESQSTVVNETPKLQSVVANSRREFLGIPTNVNSSLGVIFESQEWGGSIAEDSDCESREVNLTSSNVWTDSQIESIATRGSELNFFPCESPELSQTVVEEESIEVDSGGLVEDQVQDDIPWDSNLDQYPAKLKIKTGMDDLGKTIGAYYVFDKMSTREIALPQFSTTLKKADFISANGIQCCFLYVAIGKNLVFTHACGMVIFDPGGVFALFVTEIRQMTSFPSEVEVTMEAEFFSLRWQWDPGGMACLLISLLRAAFSMFGGSGTSASMKTVQVLGIG